MVIRVWIEEGSTEPLRAQIRQTSDVSAGFTDRVTFTRPDGVLDEVQAFLTRVARAQT